MNILVTGGMGFIGSHFVKKLVKYNNSVIIVDNMSIGSNEKNVPNTMYMNGKFLTEDFFYDFDKRKYLKTPLLYVKDIGDYGTISYILHSFKIDAVVNFAAQTHVDRSIDSCETFVKNNISDFSILLTACNDYFQGIRKDSEFKFIQISTDEVFGSLKYEDYKFNEQSNYNPLNPYAATKASAEHLLLSFNNTYGFPGIITNCCNNYGTNQYEEKFIPKAITNLLQDKPIEVYGLGENIREWIYVGDHCDILYNILLRGNKERYLIGSGDEYSNIEIAERICYILYKPIDLEYDKYIQFIEDRKGHDFRYALDTSKTMKSLFHGNQINFTDFNSGLRNTIEWYTEKRKNENKE